MKKLLLFVAFAIICHQANATVHTVNNVTSGGGQFTTINDAITAAAMGYTIYVSGRPVAYAGFNILNKKITIIGPSWAPQKNNPIRAIVGVNTIKNDDLSSIINNSDGCEVQGLVFTGTLIFSSGNDLETSVNNIRIDRCEFRGGIQTSGKNATNYIIENCYITGSSANISLHDGSSYSNFLIQNNIFRIETLNNSFFNGFNLISNFIVNHNLFFTSAPGSSGSSAAGNAVNNTTFSNNIFVNINLSFNLDFCTFNKKLVLYTSVPALPAPWTVANNIDGGGNLNNINPQIADQISVNTGVDNPIANYSIAAGPANNVGTDGKDLGLLFDATGSLNWANARGASLPFIFSMNITNLPLRQAQT